MTQVTKPGINAWFIAIVLCIIGFGGLALFASSGSVTPDKLTILSGIPTDIRYSSVRGSKNQPPTDIVTFKVAGREMDYSSSRPQGGVVLGLIGQNTNLNIHALIERRLLGEVTEIYGIDIQGSYVLTPESVIEYNRDRGQVAFYVFIVFSFIGSLNLVACFYQRRQAAHHTLETPRL